MKSEYFGSGRIALKFGNQKINLHETGNEFEPKAEAPTPGSADVCFLIQGDIDEAVEFVKAKGIRIIEGPVERTGAAGPLSSFYFRDPDYNLIELSSLKRKFKQPVVP
jgi:catechol 2,3-dioxygenase-like lactoylglutathione lyase family enzyme